MPLPCTECLSRVVYVCDCVIVCLLVAARQSVHAHAKPTRTDSPRVRKVSLWLASARMCSRDACVFKSGAGCKCHCYARDVL